MKKILSLISVFYAICGHAQTLQSVTQSGNITSMAVRINGETTAGSSGSAELVLGLMLTQHTNDTRNFIGWKGDNVQNPTTNGQAGALLLQSRTNIADMPIDLVTGYITPSLRMRIAGNGNVSIGDNSLTPAAKLLIKGGGTNNATTSLLVVNNAGTEALRVLDNGNIGVGNTNPAGVLDIQKDPAIAGNEIYFKGFTSGQNQNSNSLRLNFVGLDQTAGFGIQAVNVGSYGTKDLVFYAHDGGLQPNYTGYNEVIRFKYNGRVGIGTNAPGTKLDVVGLGATNVDFQTTGRARIYGSSPGVSFSDGTTERGFLGWAGSGISAQAIGVYTPAAGWNTLNVMTSGAIAIGSQSANADAKLDVTGNVYCNNKVFIGSPDANTVSRIANYSLAVKGRAVFNGARVMMYDAPWADFVFEEKYNLLPLAELENYIKINKHLPSIPTTDEVEKEGIDLGSNQALLLQKIEELTLYTIEQNKQLFNQQSQITELLSSVKELKSQQKK